MVKTIAFYLPQFYPILENDKWWGKGFTEWRNVTKARKLFRGHNQPIFPGSLGYYDLRVEETRIEQSKLALDHGISGFAYWHYWFGKGKKLLDRPIKEVVDSGKPEIPFCLAWANQTWSGTWHGLSSKQILIEQEYGGVEDWKNHFMDILPILSDSRYLRVDNKLLFILYRPNDIPDLREFIEFWNELATKYGLEGFYFVGLDSRDEKLLDAGISALCPKQMDFNNYVKLKKLSLPWVLNLIKRRFGIQLINNVFINRMDYLKYKSNYLKTNFKKYEIPCVYPNWDNTPRSNRNGYAFVNSKPEYFSSIYSHAHKHAKNSDSKIVFIKSWNEWAEGNILEPDSRFGLGYLEQIKKIVSE